MATAPPSRAAGGGRPAWTPAEVAQHEFELCRLLSTDRKAQSVYFRKLRVLRGVPAMGAEGLRRRNGATGRSAGGAGDTNRDVGDSSSRGEGAGGAAPIEESGSGQPMDTDTAPAAVHEAASAAANPVLATSASASPTAGGRRKSEAQRRRRARKHAEKWLVRRVREAAAPGHFSRVMGFVLAYMGQMRRIARPDGERDTGFLLWLRGEQGPARAARAAREAAQRAAAAAAPACVPLAAKPGRNLWGEAVESMLAQARQPPSAVGTVAVPLSLLSGEAAGALAAKRALPAGSVASSQPGAGRRTVRGGAGGSSQPPRKEARGDG